MHRIRTEFKYDPKATVISTPLGEVFEKRRGVCQDFAHVMIAGLPERTREGAAIDALIDDAIFEAFESLPPGKRRDAEVVSTAIERAVRGSVNTVWGKKPQVHVLVVEV